MALGRKSKVVDTTKTQDIAAMQEKNDGAFGSDLEKADPSRKMSRVGGGLNTDTDVDSTISVGKQIELEQTSSIKYRTCSWQKVGSRFLSPSGQGARYPSKIARRSVVLFARCSRFEGIPDNRQ